MNNFYILILYVLYINIYTQYSVVFHEIDDKINFYAVIQINNDEKLELNAKATTGKKKLQPFDTRV